MSPETETPPTRWREDGRQVRLAAEQENSNTLAFEVKRNPGTDKRKVALDFETFFGAEYNVLELGPHAYAEDSRFQCYQVSIIADGVLAYSGPPENAPWYQIAGAEVISHNVGFDAAVYERLQRDGVIPESIHPFAWLDSSAIAVFHHAPRNLNGSSKVLLGRKIDKSYRLIAKGRQWSDFSPDEQQQLRESCDKDALAAYEIVKKYEESWPEIERQIASAHLAHQRRGARVNQEALVKGISTLTQKKKDLESQMPWVIAGHKPSATTVMRRYVEEQGIPVPTSFSKTNAEFLDWEKKYSPFCPAIASVKEWREVNGLLMRLRSMKKRLRHDGRISVDLLYHGAATGRAAGCGFNLHSLPNGENHGVNIRAMLIPENGHVFVAADLAQIEPRCVATVLKDEKMLDQMRLGTSPYEAYARAYLGWAGGKLKVEDSRLYALAKVCVLSLAYGTGWQRFRDAAAAQGILLAEQEARTAVDAYRTTNSKIVGQWQALVQRFRAHAGKSVPFQIGLPSGRSLKYFDVSYRTEDQSYVARTELGGNFRRFWGSKLFENAIQATARDIFMGMMVQAEREGLRTLLHVHDELLVECPVEDADSVSERLTRIMTTPPDWLPDIPLSCETKILNHFQ